MASSHHFTPPCQVAARLAPLVSSSAVFLLPRWSGTPGAAVSSSLKYRKYKVRFDVNMNINSPIIFSDTVDELIPTFAVEHDHRRRSDRAPQTTASFTPDRRRAHWHTWWGKLGPNRNSAEMAARAPCACRPEGNLSTGRSHALVKALTFRTLLFPPEVDSFRCLLLYDFLNCLQSTAAGLHKLCDAGSLIPTFGREIKSKLKIMSLEVDSVFQK